MMRKKNVQNVKKIKLESFLFVKNATGIKILFNIYFTLIIIVALIAIGSKDTVFIFDEYNNKYK